MNSDRGSNGLGVLGGIGLGAALMYFLDPGRGARRRAAVRDKLAHGLHRTEHAAEATARDLRNRAKGLAAEVRGRFEREEVADEVLVERVRAELGRAVSHPSSIAVAANAGLLTLSGPILARELDSLLSRVRSVRGVRDVENRLEVHDTADGVPGLQGGAALPGGEPELLQQSWSPAARALVGAAGGVLMVAGARRRDAFGTAIGLGGLALLSRGATNIGMRRLVGGGSRKGIDIRKTINISAPVDTTFAFFTSYDNFPRFMSHVREVRDTGEGRSHWVVDGPAGIAVEWDAVVTELVENEVLAWKSVSGSAVESAGVIRFDGTGDGSTRVDVKMTYSPPAGALGHAASKLFRVDPKKQMDDDLVRAKTFLETGTRAHDAAQATAPAEALAR